MLFAHGLDIAISKVAVVGRVGEGKDMAASRGAQVIGYSDWEERDCSGLIGYEQHAVTLFEVSFQIGQQLWVQQAQCFQ
jgi:hypothetical protein